MSERQSPWTTAFGGKPPSPPPSTAAPDQAIA
jgi:hypothetical protein